MPLVPASWHEWMCADATALATAEAAGPIGAGGPPPTGLAYAFVRCLEDDIVGSRLPHDHYFHMGAGIAGWCGRRCPVGGPLCEGRCYRPVFPGVGSAHDRHACTLCHAPGRSGSALDRLRDQRR